MKQWKAQMRKIAYAIGCSIGLALLAFAGYAQRFGGIPSGIKWRQQSTEAVQVIYPEGMDSIASRIAAVTNFLNQNHKGTVGYKHHPISIVLQRDLNFSNAYVGLGPWRSEFYMSPPQNPFVLGSVSWADLLAVHEFRHVQQFSNYNVGLSKIMGILGGENGRALANVAAVPDWFFEGDAVWNETTHTGQGRGRLPLFLSAYQTLNRAGNKYSFMKMRNGSLLHFVPSHYELGYLLVSYGRQQYGDSIWKSIARDAAAFKSPLYPLQAAVKKHTGIAYKQLVKNALADFEQKWQQQQAPPEPQWITPLSAKNVIDYKYPYPMSGGDAIVVKTSYNQIPAFVTVSPDGSEKSIAVKHISYDDYFGYKNNRVVYTALETDKRWDNRDFSIIKMLDITTGKTTNITKQTRYFSPDISVDGQKLVAVEIFPDRPCQLVVLNAEGFMLQSFTTDSSFVYSHPKWLDNEVEVLVAVRRPDGKMGWMIWDTSKDEHRWLLPLENRTVGFPVVQGDTVVYTATEGLRDALYASMISSGKRVLLSTYATGIYQGFWKEGKVTASHFTAGGFRLGRAEAMGAPILQRESKFVPLYSYSNVMPDSSISQLPNTTYASTPYKKRLRFINFHSWQPELNEPNYTLRVLGNNVLNTSLTDLFYTFNTNEQSHAAGFNFIYGGWFLQPTAGIRQTWARSVFYNADTTFIFNETEASAGFRLPFNFSGGKQFRYLTLSSRVVTNNVAWQGIGKGLLANEHYTYLNTRWVYSGQIQKARQHIFPRFAQWLLADFNRMLDNHQSWQVLVSGMLYLPGLSTNHNLVLTAAWQGRDTLRQYTFTNSFPFSRGYNGPNFPRMWRLGANYHFPMLYPDWGFGHLVYLLRLRANIFYDYTVVKSLRTQTTRPFAATGIELFADTRIWNQLPITIGVRYSRLLHAEFSGNNNRNQWEIVLPVNLF